MKKLWFLASIFIAFNAKAQLFLTPYEKSKGNETATYAETIEFYQRLDAASPKVTLKTMGATDAGLPLHLVMVSTDGSADPAQWHRQNKAVLLIINGIHPGEPDGVDASMMLVRDIVTGKKILPTGTALAIIPIYNIGGALNRSETYRVDQNGPNAFGGRGNAQNLDLNRDFIKCDSKDALSFADLFHYVQPDILIDNHVSNGADYQHTMTLLTTQHSKLGGEMGKYLNQVFEPAIYAAMKKKGYDLIPYVNAFGDNPASGWSAYWDGPRYSSGYAALWQSFSFVPETHMLKPYPERVAATGALMDCFIEYADVHRTNIKTIRANALKQQINQTEFPISWRINKNEWSEIFFKGYTPLRKDSEVSGLPRLYYDRNKPFDMQVKFFNFFEPNLVIKKPLAYVIPKGWWKVIERLQANRITMRQLKNDSTIWVEVYRIEDYKSSPRPYEGHHPNSEVKVSASVKEVKFRKGDWYIPMNQKGNRFLMEVLEPQGDDSYFAWNFFDPILQQKEGYSSYAFEDIAASLLREHPEWQTKLNEKRNSDTAFAKNAAAQLNFVYQLSPYYEKEHLRYPVFRVVSK
ncbi:MAG: M14 family metallopeptidase [Chitinophagaceae bacterium]